jgi:hypothetical protein
MRAENWGVCRTQNQGLGLVSGQVFTSLGSDDVLPHDALERRVRFLLDNPEVDILATDFDVLDADGGIHTGSEKLEICPQFRPYFGANLLELYGELLLGNFLPDSAITVALDRIHPDDLRYDERCPLVSDWDLWLRMARSHEWAYLPESTVHYRWHGGNLSWPRDAWEPHGEVIAQRIYILSKALTEVQTLDRRRSILQQIGTLWRKFSVILPDGPVPTQHLAGDGKRATVVPSDEKLGHDAIESHEGRPMVES